MTAYTIPKIPRSLSRKRRDGKVGTAADQVCRSVHGINDPEVSAADLSCRNILFSDDLMVRIGHESCLSSRSQPRYRCRLPNLDDLLWHVRTTHLAVWSGSMHRPPSPTAEHAETPRVHPSVAPLWSSSCRRAGRCSQCNGKTSANETLQFQKGLKSSNRLERHNRQNGNRDEGPPGPPSLSSFKDTKAPSLHELQDGAGTPLRVVLLVALREERPAVFVRRVRLLDQLEPAVDRFAARQQLAESVADEVFAVLFLLAGNGL